MSQGGIEATHEADHNRLLLAVGAVQIAGEVGSRLDRMGQGLFEENTLAGLDELAAVALMICRARGDDGSLTDTGCEEIVNRAKRSDPLPPFVSFGPQLRGDAICRLPMVVDDGDQFTHPGATRHILNVSGVEEADAPDADNGNSQRFRHIPAAFAAPPVFIRDSRFIRDNRRTARRGALWPRR